MDLLDSFCGIFTEKVGVKQSTSTLGEKSVLTSETKLVTKQVEVELKTSKDDQIGSQQDAKKHQPAASAKDMSLSPTHSPPQSRSR